MADKIKQEKGFMSKFVKWLLNSIVFLTCFIVAVMVIYVFSAQLHAKDENYKPLISFYTIVSPSMNPVIKVYDVVVNVKPSDPSKIEVGDIITYVSTNSTSEGMTITHRVVAIYPSENGTYEYQTQGDNNSEPDSVLVTYDNVIGKEIFILPALGRIQFLLADKKGWVFLLLIPIGLFILKDLYEILVSISLKKRIDKVTGYVEESDRAIKLEKEKERKEIIKRELIINELKADALVRSKSEGSGFLEPYSENVITVGKLDDKPKEIKPKEVEKITIVKPDVIVGEEVVANTDNEELNKTISNLEPVIAPIEILDTDELTHKIKMYDEKLVQLNNMLKELESMKLEQKAMVKEVKEVPVKNEKKIETQVDEADYLVGKLKVVNVEVAQRKRGRPRKVVLDEEVLLKTSILPQVGNMISNKTVLQEEKKEEKQPTKIEIQDRKLNVKEIEPSVDKEEIVSVTAPIKKEEISRIEVPPVKKEETIKVVVPPVNSDEVTKVVVSPIKKTEPKEKEMFGHIDELLGMNEQDNKEVNIKTDNEIIKELNNFYKKEDKDLIFNPKIINKVDKNENVNKEEKKKKKSIIIIQKVKKNKKKK